MGFETTRYAKTRPGRRGGVRRGERWGRREPGAKQTRGVALLGPSRSRGSRSQRGLGRGRASVGGGRLFSSRERFGPRGRSVDLPPRPLRTRTTSALARGSSLVTRLTSFLSDLTRLSSPVVVPSTDNLKPSRRAEEDIYLNRVFYPPLKRRAGGPKAICIWKISFFPFASQVPGSVTASAAGGETKAQGVHDGKPRRGGGKPGCEWRKSRPCGSRGTYNPTPLPSAPRTASDAEWR